MQQNLYRQLSIDNYFSKILYINLQRDTERNAHMIRQFAAYGITNYERVEALALQELPASARYRNFINKEPRYVLGSLSCAASHLSCMRLARERNYTNVLILEDDVVFREHPGQLLTQNLRDIDGWDMLYFGGLVEPHFRNQVVGTYAYAIKHTLYADILEMTEASGMEIDNFYAKIIQHMSYNHNPAGRYNIRLIRPFNMIVPDKRFGSNIR